MSKLANRWAINGPSARVPGMAIVLLVALSAPGLAAIENLRMEGWTDQGVNQIVNQAALVVDFSPAVGDSFAFGARFGSTSSDTISGFDLLSQLQDRVDNKGVRQGIPGFGFDYIDYGWGKMIDEIWYTDPRTSILHDVGADYPAAWWSYWNSNDAGQTWPSASSGIVGRTLGNGGTDGFVPVPGSFELPLPGSYSDTYPIAPMQVLSGHSFTVSDLPSDFPTDLRRDLLIDPMVLDGTLHLSRSATATTTLVSPGASAVLDRMSATAVYTTHGLTLGSGASLSIIGPGSTVIDGPQSFVAGTVIRFGGSGGGGIAAEAASPDSVPEPSTVVLLLTAAAALFFCRRKQYAGWALPTLRRFASSER